MDLRLEGKVALLTGASRGLGKAAATEMARAGARVVISARGPDLDQTAEEIRQITNAEVLPIRADLIQADDITRLVRTAMEQMRQIDVLFLNAGGPPTGGFLDLSPEDWERGFQLTVMSSVRLCYAVVPHMIERGSGSILANQSFTVETPAQNLTLSNALRLSVIGLVRTLANELGPKGIRVNAINAGWTRTERVDQIMSSRADLSGASAEAEAAKVAGKIPLRRMADTEEFGRAAAWLASPAASYVHGHSFFVDGGLTQTSL
ncbi:MAG: SDR family oxidoreductase [Anaerolineales bacterium]|jgi:3-oxoacyl-[acyl-carrier protein] reductase